MCLPGPLAPNVETYSYFCGHPLLWSGPANAEHCGEGKRLVQKLLRSLVFAILPVVLSCRGGRDSITSLLAGLAEIDHMVRSLRVMFNGVLGRVQQLQGCQLQSNKAKDTFSAFK